jgi:hypothetical protein
MYITHKTQTKYYSPDSILGRIIKEKAQSIQSEKTPWKIPKFLMPAILAMVTYTGFDGLNNSVKAEPLTAQNIAAEVLTKNPNRKDVTGGGIYAGLNQIGIENMLKEWAKTNGVSYSKSDIVTLSQKVKTVQSELNITEAQAFIKIMLEQPVAIKQIQSDMRNNLLTDRDAFVNIENTVTQKPETQTTTKESKNSSPWKIEYLGGLLGGIAVTWAGVSAFGWNKLREYKKFAKEGLNLGSKIPEGQEVIAKFNELENSTDHLYTLQFLQNSQKLVENANANAESKGCFVVECDVDPTPNMSNYLKFDVGNQESGSQIIEHGWHINGSKNVKPSEKESMQSLNNGHLDLLNDGIALLTKIDRSAKEENKLSKFKKVLFGRNQEIHRMLIDGKFSNNIFQDISPLFLVSSEAELETAIEAYNSKSLPRINQVIAKNLKPYDDLYNVFFVPTLHSAQGSNCVETGNLTLTKNSTNKFIMIPDHAGLQAMPEGKRVMYCMNGTMCNIDQKSKKFIGNIYGTAFGSPETRMTTFLNTIRILVEYKLSGYSINALGDMNTYGLIMDFIKGRGLNSNGGVINKAYVLAFMLASRLIPFVHSKHENSVRSKIAVENDLYFNVPKENTFRTPVEEIGRLVNMTLDGGLSNEEIEMFLENPEKFDHKLTTWKPKVR